MNAGTDQASRMEVPHLLRVFPALTQAVPWSNLPGSSLPTPVEPLSVISERLWIKRDDLSNQLYGGNKSRKLAFILADLQQRGKRQLVTFGATGTNHGVATSLFCQRLGIDCTILLFDQPASQTVTRNYALMQRMGAHLIPCGSLANTVAHFYLWQRLKQPHAYFLFAGGSDVPGVLAFVNAAFELKEQIQQGLLPSPKVVICPVGSSATLAGLSLGMQLAGLAIDVQGVRVAPSHLGPFAACTPATIRRLMRRTYQYLKRRAPSLPDITLVTPTLLENYYGAGYGEATPEGLAAMRLLRESCGIELEQTYTAKAFAATLDIARTNPTHDVLYWHTFNSVDMTPLP